MKYLILASIVFLGFGCASTKKSYCDIVEQANAPVLKDSTPKKKK